jgi:hypothetical protein
MAEYIDVSGRDDQIDINGADIDMAIEEAAARMERLDMNQQAISAMRNGEIWISEGPGALFDIPNTVENEYLRDSLEQIRNKDMFPYHVIHNFTEFGELFSVLVISSYLEEWEMDREELEQGYVFADVYNKDMDLDDLGTIGVQPSIGGLIRTS